MSLYPPPQSSVCSALFSYIPFTSSSLFKLSSLKLGLLLLAEFRSTKMRIQFSHFVSWRSGTEVFLSLDVVQPPFPNASSPLLFHLNSHLSSLYFSSSSPFLLYSPRNSQKPITSLVRPKIHVDNTWYVTHFISICPDRLWASLSYIKTDILNLSRLFKMF